MTSERVLEKLTALENASNPEEFNKILQGLKKELKEDIALQSCSAPSEKKRLKAALKFLKAISSTRETLSYSNIEEFNGVNYQVFTDSYTAFKLAQPLDLPKFEDFKKDHPGASFPELKRLFNVSPCESLTIDYKTVVNYIKSNPEKKKDDYIMLLNAHDYVIAFSALRLKATFEILGVESMDLQLSGKSRPALVKCKGGEALLCPMRYNA